MSNLINLKNGASDENKLTLKPELSTTLQFKDSTCGQLCSIRAHSDTEGFYWLFISNDFFFPLDELVGNENGHLCFPL